MRRKTSEWHIDDAHNNRTVYLFTLQATQVRAAPLLRAPVLLTRNLSSSVFAVRRSSSPQQQTAIKSPDNQAQTKREIFECGDTLWQWLLLESK